MKKIFTLVSVALCALSANAQEVWTVNEGETLKADYVANAEANAMSVVKFETANVTGTHTSGPISGYNDGALVDGKLEAQYDNTWGELKAQALSSDGSVAPFYYVQGKGNPVNLDKIEFEEIITDGVPTGKFRAKWDNAYYSPDGTAGLPKNGTYVTLTPKTAGKLKAMVWVNKGNRDLYVAKASDAKALQFGTDITASGYVQATNNNVAEGSPLYGYMLYQENIATKGDTGNDAYIIGEGNRPVWAYLTFDAAANETYYIFCKSTQVGFGGFEFTAGTNGISDITADKAKADAPVFNLAGQRVSKNAKGILIQNGKKFIAK